MTHTTDAFIKALDSGLRTLFAAPHATRAVRGMPQDVTLTPTQQQHSAALMRVNHVGEVCAQGLYASQALGARVFHGDEALARHLEAASAEETDHLAWTSQRLAELQARPSLLNPLWYAGSFALGLAAARLGKGVSLGFVVETERQVEAHLAEHMQALDAADVRSQAIVTHMKADEAQHAAQAQAGATALPQAVQHAMRAAAKVMTTVAHHI
ncbi:2-polyprenyl-3-methyl-6-methoxy-1,4-benzoquinone monooxygenase [Comamonadaceae bacterium M7527]|nr:2-polyprenyl-3-methyl-6-methoxy-1,4-benzoquinone monooxygenase [Comamonadaceae bacterium M7527]